MSPEVKNPIEEQKPEEGKNTDTNLRKEFDKKDDNNVATGIDLMATKEIDAIEFSDDERTNPEYMKQFSELKNNLKTETETIINNKNSTPEEKTKELKLAFDEFQAEIWKKRAPKEATDAKIATENSKRMEEWDKKNEQWSREFRKTLLESIKKVTDAKAQEQKLAAKIQWNTECKISQNEAGDTMAQAEDDPACWPSWKETSSKV